MTGYRKFGMAAVLIAACAGTPAGTAVEHGRAVFTDRAASPAATNELSCASCHTGSPSDEDGRILPGARLAGVVERSTFWGGQEDDLFRAVNHCRTYFMGAPDPWTRDDEEAKVLYAYLGSLQGLATPSPFGLVQRVEDLPPGDPRRGADVYSGACRSCHGLLEAGLGRLNGAPALAGQTDASEPVTERRLRMTRKVRHGAFLGESGTMPPFSREALSDADLGSLLAYLGAY